MQARSNTEAGFTIVELLIALTIAALLMTAMTGLINGVFETRDDTAFRSAATRDARFAMQRMITAVLGTERLLLPLADNPNTSWREHVREETVPASPPDAGSTLATAVLAVTLDPTLDIDGNGWADANNDRDYLDLNNDSNRDPGEPERIDEDLDRDNNFDGEKGLIGIDDNGDGQADGPGPEFNDDEDSNDDEDDIGNGDADGDGAQDEDTDRDMNGDGAPGIAGIDDDYDGSIDEGSDDDDDEDGISNEDWFDTVAFFLSGSTLIERRPNLNPTDGTDYTEYPIAENITHFRVERIPDTGKRSVLVDITLELTLPDLGPVSFNTRVRVGGGS